ncbi:DNA primase [Aestuariivirga litoralis]|uniref:DNA primase n=1 Tax=Aestuariivirga litoralis TaxID=2650924 RepID=UPI0018C6CFA4|nr:DNA primase [Aestuariivirga litoralis]MBG1231114.1 DNA primase [Aestuariivirga litoralis]
MRFPPSFLDDIRARVTISSVIGRKVAWDRRKSNPGKGDFWACCPFHGEKSPSFHADDRKGRYYCFGCKQSGDIFTYLVEKEGVPFPEAVSQLAQEAGLPMPEFSEADAKREQQRTSLYEIMEISAKFFQAELQSARGAKARGYLSDRGLSAQIQQQFGLGYAPDDRSALRTHLAEKNVTVEQMAEAGLVIAGDDIPVAYDRFRDRVMFPIRDARGRVIAFGGRALRPDVPAKYLNSPETPLFHKGDNLYNFDKARAVAHEKSEIIVVEGYVDVIAMSRAGLSHAVAPLGTALTENQLNLLWKTVSEPTLCFDGDGAGLKAAYRALDLALPLLKAGHSLKFAFLPEGQDPDDLLKAEGPESVRQVVAASEPLAQVLWRRALNENDRATPERRAAFERDLRSIINTIQDDVVKKHYLADVQTRLAELFGGGPANQRRSGGAFTPRNPRLRFGQKPWEQQLPVSPQLKALASKPSQTDGAERRARQIVLTFINHPDLMHEFWADFSGVDLISRELDSLRTQILDSASSEESLETASLRTHLSTRGFGPQLARLEAQAKSLNEWHLSPAAAADDARTGLRQMIALHHKAITLDRELKAAEAAFAGDMTEENFSTVQALRDQLSSLEGREAMIDGFGAASGRKSGEVV